MMCYQLFAKIDQLGLCLACLTIHHSPTFSLESGLKNKTNQLNEDAKPLYITMWYYLCQRKAKSYVLKTSMILALQLNDERYTISGEYGCLGSKD